MISNCTANVFGAQYVGGKHGPETYGLDGWIYYAKTDSLGYVTNTFEKIINNAKSSQQSQIHVRYFFIRWYEHIFSMSLA